MLVVPFLILLLCSPTLQEDPNDDWEIFERLRQAPRSCSQLEVLLQHVQSERDERVAQLALLRARMDAAKGSCGRAQLAADSCVACEGRVSGCEAKRAHAGEELKALREAAEAKDAAMAALEEDNRLLREEILRLRGGGGGGVGGANSKKENEGKNLEQAVKQELPKGEAKRSEAINPPQKKARRRIKDALGSNPPPLPYARSPRRRVG
jgi:hypothetical protein